MRRSILALVLAVAAIPVPAGAACAGIADPAGDATVADDMVMNGAYDAPVPAPSLDIRSARVVATKAGAEIAIRVADLNALAVEAPTGAAFSWWATSARDARNVMVTAYVTPQRSGISVIAFRSGDVATTVADYAATVVDAATGTVRMSVAAKHLGWLRPGVPVSSVVTTRRVAGAHDGSRMAMQGAGADEATDRARPWGRAGC